MQTPFVFRCPLTAISVQGMLDDAESDPADGRRLYKPVECTACGGVHLFNPLTCRMMSEEAED